MPGELRRSPQSKRFRRVFETPAAVVTKTALSTATMKPACIVPKSVGKAFIPNCDEAVPRARTGRWQGEGSCDACDHIDEWLYSGTGLIVLPDFGHRPPRGVLTINDFRLAGELPLRYFRPDYRNRHAAGAGLRINIMGRQPRNTDSREQKRTRFSEPKRRSKAKSLILIAVFAAAAAVVYAAFNNSGSATAVATAKDVESVINIPVADLADGKAKFFNFTAADNTKMRFFAIRSSDGVYRAALDACDVCYREKQGYRQDGDDMVCKKCGQRFHSALVNKVTGGCNPVAIERSVVGDKLVIKTAELESRKAFF